jgi:hypothetical protein
VTSPAAQVTDHLPDLKTEPQAQVRTRTREAGSRVAWMQRAASKVLTGSVLLTRQPPSVAAVWARHLASARHHNAGLLRGPRYLWGAVHTPFAAAVYLLSWLASSLPLLLVTALTLFLIHLFL